MCAHAVMQHLAAERVDPKIATGLAAHLSRALAERVPPTSQQPTAAVAPLMAPVLPPTPTTPSMPQQFPIPPAAISKNGLTIHIPQPRYAPGASGTSGTSQAASLPTPPFRFEPRLFRPSVSSSADESGSMDLSPVSSVGTSSLSPTASNSPLLADPVASSSGKVWRPWK